MRAVAIVAALTSIDSTPSPAASLDLRVRHGRISLRADQVPVTQILRAIDCASTDRDAGDGSRAGVLDPQVDCARQLVVHGGSHRVTMAVEDATLPELLQRLSASGSYVAVVRPDGALRSVWIGTEEGADVSAVASPDGGLPLDRPASRSLDDDTEARLEQAEPMDETDALSRSSQSDAYRAAVNAALAQRDSADMRRNTVAFLGSVGVDRSSQRQVATSVGHLAPNQRAAWMAAFQAQAEEMAASVAEQPNVPPFVVSGCSGRFPSSPEE